MKRFFSLVRLQMPWIVIGIVFLWALVSVISRQHTQESPGIITIRLGHWQLEAGVREGFAHAAAQYEKLHPNVRIVQDAIPESTYGQWLTTQLMGDTAPDILEVGMVDGSMVNALYTRYFLPLSKYITRPNPYNAGTDLAGKPLAQTCKDGLRHSYIPAVQEYMVLPLTLSSIRVYYNKTLLKKLTGLSEAPTDYRAFLKVCNQIRSQKQPNGQSYIALAGSRYHFPLWENSMARPLTYDALQDIDFNRDGLFAGNEMFFGFLTGKVSFDTPAYRGCFGMVDELTHQFPGGWSGLARDEAVFNFAQQKDVFMAIGIYEAAGILDQAAGKFDLGLMDFPMPLPTDPDYGRLVEGHRYEVSEGNMPMGITRSSHHPDIAMDFLLFLTSRAQNEEFNERLKWIPIVLGAKTDPSLKVFEPILEGVFSAFDPNVGPLCSIRWSQLYTLYQIHQISYEDMAKQFTQFYVTKGREDFAEFLRNVRRSQLEDEHLSVQLREEALETTGAESQDFWGKHRNVVLSEDGRDQSIIQLGVILTDPDSLKRQNFYRYTPYALAKIRASLTPPTP